MKKEVYECKECEMKFTNGKIFANHVRWKHVGDFKKSGKENFLKKCSERTDKRYGKVINCNAKCSSKKCDSIVEFSYREKVGRKEKYFCSIRCANSRKLDYIKIGKKVSKTLKDKWKKDTKYRNSCVEAITKNKSMFASAGELALKNFLKTKDKDSLWASGGALRVKDEYIVRDMYSKKLKVCVEYDGVWHFKDIHGQLKKKQYKDNLLYEWCKENNYKLIRVKDEVYKKNPEAVGNIVLELSKDKSKKGLILLYDCL